jgi:cellulose synthase/poly-beta-1,6-N-acetylglucosamine synthase-like glycosyltransferase
MNPELSIVIIGRNEGERLVNCIRSVQAADYPQEKIETIYVDSASSDDSVKQAQALGVQVIEVQPERPAAAMGRNAGWQRATAPVVLFLDGDTELHADFIKTALTHFQTPSVGAICGHRREKNPHRSIYQQVLDLDWITFHDCGGDVMIRRDLLEKINGYNPTLIAGEDPEICQRIHAEGYTVVHLDQPMTLHELGITRGSQYWRRAVRTGHAYAEVSQLLKDTSTPLWQKEARKNWINSSLLLAIVIVGIILSVMIQSMIPIIISFGVLLLLSLRSAWKARWRTKELDSLLLYGFHSQFQHIPIVIGQITFYYHRWRGQRKRLIEYK